jgi:dynein heavy chain
MNLITVPTSETVANSYFAQLLMEMHYPVMMIGLSGCGKTQQCRGILEALTANSVAGPGGARSQFSTFSINMNYYTDSTLLQSMMEMPLEKKAGRLFAPPGNQRLIYYIDDLNMPALDPYNTQSAISLLRQYQDYGHWYDRTKIIFKDIGNTQLLCSMNPTAGSFVIDQRLQRHFWTCSIPFPDQSALSGIFETFMKGHFGRLPFKSAVTETVAAVIKSSLGLHGMVVKSFRKTASNFHYEFNIRHISGVFSGLLQVTPADVTDAEKLITLWIHESDRVYADRLINFADNRKYKQPLALHLLRSNEHSRVQLWADWILPNSTSNLHRP